MLLRRQKGLCLISPWMNRGRVVMMKVVVYGAEWCPDCVRSKAFLDRHKIAYTYVDIDKNSKMADRVVELNERLGNGPIRRIPTIVIGTRKVLSEPSDKELADALGITG